jgi:hypothetical protein
VAYTRVVAHAWPLACHDKIHIWLWLMKHGIAVVLVFLVVDLAEAITHLTL